MKLSRPRSIENMVEFLSDRHPSYIALQQQNASRIYNRMDEEMSEITKRSRSRDKRDEKLYILEEYKLRQSICSRSLDQIIDLQSESQDLLTEIRNEYERFLDALVQGEIQYEFIYEQLKKVTTDPITLALLRRRRDELEKKITILNDSNQKIANQILKINQSLSRRNASPSSNDMARREEPSSKINFSNNKTEQNKSANTRKEKSSIFAAVTLSGATDVDRLTSYLTKVQNKVNKLSNSLKTQYTSKTKQNDLKDQVCKKENIQHHLLIYNSKLKERFKNLKLSIESIKKARPPSSEKSLSMFSVVKTALESHRESENERISDHNYESEGIFEDDDPTKKRNEERLMDYIDTFNEMISAKEYEQAAKHAANSPKAILRTFEIMKIFKDLENDDAKDASPRMLFCEALMSTADRSALLSGALSCEVIKCALANQRIDLASYWLSKDCFKLSLPMANLFLDFCKCDNICKCGSMNLAKEIFHRLGAYRQASLCLLSAGKIHQMIQYGEDHDFTVHDYMFLCKRYPSTKLLLFLVSAHPEVNIPGLISFPYAVSVLLNSCDSNVLLELLKEVHKNGIVSVDNSRKTLTEIIFAETNEDEMSTTKWLKVIDFCTADNLTDIAMDLLAIITVRDALDTASYKCILDYIS